MQKPVVIELMVEQLQIASWNYKTGKVSAEKRERFRNSIKHDSSVGVLAVRELEDNRYEVIDGNHRLEEIINLGWKTVYCENFGKISQARAVLISRRRNASWFTDDQQRIDDLMQNIVNPEIPIEEYVNYMPETMQEYKKELGIIDKDTEPQIDRVQELLAKWQVKTGQVWQLGKHKIICGDCTNLKVVEKLMDVEKAEMCITSPPYWVGKSYETQKTINDVIEFIDNICKIISFIVKIDCSRIVLNTGTGKKQAVEKNSDCESLLLLDWWINSLKKYDWIIRHCRIWSKSGQLPALIGPNSDVVDMHWEFIATFYNNNGKYKGQNKIDGNWAQQGIWDFPGKADLKGHGAAFPIEMANRNILLYSDINSIIFEPFLGSGTTLIACENLNRQCRGVEIAPEYIAVTLQRWQDHTHQFPVLLQE